MPYTDAQIRDYALKLEKAGAKLDEIDNFVRLAKEEQMSSMDNRQIGSPKGLQEKVGFLQGLARDISNPFLRTLESGKRAIVGSYQLATGQLDKAAETVDSERAEDYGYLGKIKPVSKPMESIGVGAEIGATLAPAGTVKTVGQVVGSGIKTGLKSLGNLAATGGVVAATSATGEKLSKGGEVVDSLWEGLKAVPMGATIGTIPGVKALTGKTLELTKKEVGARLINSLIKPAQRDFAYGKNPGRTMSELGITGKNFEELGTRVSEKLTELGNKIQQVAEKSNIKFNIDDALNPIDEAIEEAMSAPRTNAGLISRLQSLKDDLLGVTTDELGGVTTTRKMTDLTATELLEFKRLVGSLTKYSGTPSDDKAANAALKRVYTALKTKLEAVPGIKKTSQQVSDLIGAEHAIANRENIVARSALNSLSDYALGGTGAVVGAALSGGAGAALMGAAGILAQKASKNPMVVSKMASWLAKAPNYQKELLFAKYPQLKNILIDSLTGSSVDNQASENTENEE